MLGKNETTIRIEFEELSSETGERLEYTDMVELSTGAAKAILALAKQMEKQEMGSYYSASALNEGQKEGFFKGENAKWYSMGNVHKYMTRYLAPEETEKGYKELDLLKMAHYCLIEYENRRLMEEGKAITPYRIDLNGSLSEQKKNEEQYSEELERLKATFPDIKVIDKAVKAASEKTNELLSKMK